MNTYNNCVFHIHNFYSNGEIEEEITKQETTIPAELNTEKAQQVWKIAQERGWVDNNLKPIVPKAKAALLANMIIDKLGLYPKWTILEDFWQIPYLRVKYDKAMESANANEFLGNITAAYQNV